MANSYHRGMAETVTQVELDGQYRALRDEAGYVVGDRAALLVAGPDAAEYLQGQLSNDTEALAPGAGCYAALLDRKGHLTSDMRVLRLAGGDFLLDLEPAAATGVLKHLRTYSIGREVQVEDETDRRTLVSVIGPRAPELTGFDGLAPEYAQRSRQWDGVGVVGVATDTGLDLLVPPDQESALVAALDAAGIPRVSVEAAEILRIETGRPRFALDMGPDHMPAEAGIVDRAVNFEKGCYIGQEPVARLHYKGRPNRSLRGLRLSQPAPPGTSLRLGDKEVGTLGSAGISPALGPIALAIVRREAAPGDRVTVGDDGATAEVVELPFAF
jgi:tRNA-modifying protein YgfZ